MVATLRPQFPNLETGWANVQALGETQAMADRQAAASGDAGATSTGCGENFDEALVALGAPSGTMQAGPPASTAC